VLDGYGADNEFRESLEAFRLPFTLVRYLAAARWLRERGFDAGRHEEQVRSLVGTHVLTRL
jgi:hypothetical protein